MRDLSRLLRPKSIAVIGGGAWCRKVVQTSKSIGFDGTLWPVHPTADQVGGMQAFPSLAALPEIPDAAYIGVNRDRTIDTLQQLNALGSGGAVCLASGFSEMEAEDAGASARTQALLNAAGDMPVLGPNCYGFLNLLDRVALWPDQHGLAAVDRGVAILTQSSNIALNLTMQQRALPVAQVITVGNQTALGQAELARVVAGDPRITAIGLHIEGFRDLDQWQEFAAEAHARNLPVVVIKSGRSDAAQAATLSHTASLAGSHAGARALIDRLGFAYAESLEVFLATLSIFHVNGALATARISSTCCSGGEASLVADTAEDMEVTFPELSGAQQASLHAALGPRVVLANPLDYHTYIWGDEAAIAEVFAAMAAGDVSITLPVFDVPRSDRCDPAEWECVIAASIAARHRTGRPFAAVASLSELMPEPVAKRLIEGGVVPLSGIETALKAVVAAASVSAPKKAPLMRPTVADKRLRLIDEHAAKLRLAACGVPTPPSGIAASVQEAVAKARQIGGHVAIKSLGLAHKSDAGGVRLNLATDDDVRSAAEDVPGYPVLVEAMIGDIIAELLIGVVQDPAHGIVMTIGAGGILTELLDDSVSLLLPVDAQDISAAIGRLKCARLLGGYRGAPSANMDALVEAILAVQAYVRDHPETMELEINPMLATPTGAWAADALLREGTEET
ncbi:MAG: acetate--CoA ligase family protein [Pseudomonadota bacterium]